MQDIVLFSLLVLSSSVVLGVGANVTKTKATAVTVFNDKCNRTVDLYEEVSSPPLTKLNAGQPFNCWYKFRAMRSPLQKDWVVRIFFNKFNMGRLVNSTHCIDAFMQIIDGSSKSNFTNRREPGMFCGEIELPQMFVSESNFVKIVFRADKYSEETYYSFHSGAQDQMEIFARYGRHPQMFPNRRGFVSKGSYCEKVFLECRTLSCFVQSPGYPGIYPRGLRCTYRLNTKASYIKLFLENELISLDGRRCENAIKCPLRTFVSGPQYCPNDYMRIHDGRDASAPQIGTFCGLGRFPFSIIGTGQDMFVEFVSSRAGPLLNTGFHFTVGNWIKHAETRGLRVGDGTCDFLLTERDPGFAQNKEGLIVSPAHWYPPNTACTYRIQAPQNQIIRVYFSNLRVNSKQAPIKKWKESCAESLTLFDDTYANGANVLKAFCDSFSRSVEHMDFVSTGNSMFLRFQSKTGSYSGSSLYYWIHYDFFNNTSFGTPIRGTVCDQHFASWKQKSGQLRSPTNTLIYKQANVPMGKLKCRYIFETDRAFYARILLTVKSVNFKDSRIINPSSSCWKDKIEKLLVWESVERNVTYSDHGQSSNIQSPICLHENLENPVYYLTSGSQFLNLQLVIDASKSAENYYKRDKALFEAEYEYVHEPFCGPSVVNSMAEQGDIVFPHTPAFAYSKPLRTVHCIWDIPALKNRDIMLQFQRVRFVSTDCRDGYIDIFVPSKPNRPTMTVCGNNVSALTWEPKRISSDLMTSPNQEKYVRIRFVGLTLPTQAELRIVWTQLHHFARYEADIKPVLSKLTDRENNSKTEKEDPLRVKINVRRNVTNELDNNIQNDWVSVTDSDCLCPKEVSLTRAAIEYTKNKNLNRRRRATHFKNVAEFAKKTNHPNKTLTTPIHVFENSTSNITTEQQSKSENDDSIRINLTSNITTEPLQSKSENDDSIRKNSTSNITTELLQSKHENDDSIQKNSTSNVTTEQLQSKPENDDSIRKNSTAFELRSIFDCDFVCPGTTICLPMRFVCDGISHCPPSIKKLNNTANFTAIIADEDVLMCHRESKHSINGIILIVGGILSGILIVAFVCVVCKILYPGPQDEESDHTKRKSCHSRRISGGHSRRDSRSESRRNSRRDSGNDSEIDHRRYSARESRRNSARLIYENYRRDSVNGRNLNRKCSKVREIMKEVENDRGSRRASRIQRPEQNDGKPTEVITDV